MQPEYGVKTEIQEGVMRVTNQNQITLQLPSREPIELLIYHAETMREVWRAHECAGFFFPDQRRYINEVTSTVMLFQLYELELNGPLRSDLFFERSSHEAVEKFLYTLGIYTVRIEPQSGHTQDVYLPDNEFRPIYWLKLNDQTRAFGWRRVQIETKTFLR